LTAAIAAAAQSNLPSFARKSTATTAPIISSATPAIYTTLTDVTSATDLRSTAARTQDAKAARRMLAIALLLEGCSREAAAEACAMDRQTLCDWVHRYNALGLAGLFDRPRRNGPQPRLSAEQQAQVAAWVEQGPTLERDGVVRWRCVDLQLRIAQEFAVQLHERTVGKLLRRLSFRHVSVRPQHPQSRPEDQAVFSATSLIS
jgi:transposase